jgi:hypothetical protein
MNLLRERGIVKPFLVLLFLFLALKGWVLLSLVDKDEGATCMAEPVSADESSEQPAFAPGEEACDLRVGGLINRIQSEESRLDEKAMRLDEKERRLQVFSRELFEKLNNLKNLRIDSESTSTNRTAPEREAATSRQDLRRDGAGKRGTEARGNG